MILNARAAAAASLLIVCAACSSSGTGSAATDPLGPPHVQVDVVAEHAGQFDGPLATRPAGSQREFAAATYLLGHLQEAGYTPLLDPVPVQDLIRSTNVVANPPRAAAPDTVVVVPYDTGPGNGRSGSSLGTWLELARALYARDPGHTTGFVALGAEHATVGGGNLGSRRLAEYLIDNGLHPVVIVLGSVTEGPATFRASGSAAGEVEDAARSLGLEGAVSEVGSPTAEVFRKAGFHNATVSGSVEDVGRVLLDVLAGDAPSTASPR